MFNRRRGELALCLGERAARSADGRGWVFVGGASFRNSEWAKTGHIFLFRSGGSARFA